MGPFSLPFLFGIVKMYYVFKSLEEHFVGKYADFATCLLFNAVFGLLVAYLANRYVIMEAPFVFSLIYVWSKLMPDLQMSIWGFPVMSANLPWVMMAFSLFTGGDIFTDLVGVVIGHTYIFLTKILPDSHGYNLLKTPGFLVTLVDKL